MSLLRKLRGVLSIGLTWAASWVVVGTALGLIVRVIDPDSIDPGEGIAMIRVFATIGFISGVGFAGLLSVAESRKTILNLSLGRVALWGILGGAVVPLVVGLADQLFIFCPLGALSATASVAIARSGELHAPEQPRVLDG